MPLIQYDTPESRMTENFQRVLVDQWTSKLRAAKDSRAAFDKIGEQCMSFYSKDCGFMWDGEFYDSYLKGVQKPYMKVTINKTAEFVDIYEPYLLWDNPYRQLTPIEQMAPTPELLMMFSDPNDPQAEQRAQMQIQQHGQKKLITDIRTELWSKWLNYTPNEQVEKLTVESGDAIREALTRGRGCLWYRSYSHPGSNRRLSGMFYESVLDLLIDPDCNDPALKSATWIACQHINNTTELERKWGLPKGTLKQYATLDSATQAVLGRKGNDWFKSSGRTHDLIVWYEIYSKNGVGTRQKDIKTSQGEIYDELVGDFAYMAIAPTVPWLLNAPPPIIYDEDEDIVAQRFSWPCPLLARDSRWPVALLDFKRKAKSAWPMPPLASAMGELICLNILTSAALERGYESRKLIIGYLKSEAKQVEDKLKKETSGTVFFEITDQLQKSVRDCIQYLEAPGMAKDLWDAIAYVSNLFDMRTGLVPFMYGSNAGAVDRSAKAIASKEEHTAIRPDKMSRDVATWQTNAAEIERLGAALDITGEDVRPLMGDFGAMLWDAFITNGDPEEIAREVAASVSASDIRKPNKERENENIQNMMGWLLPVLEQVAMLRGDEEGVQPLRAFITSIGKAMDQDVSGWLPPTFAPTPDPQMQQLQQAMMQSELQKNQADAENKMAGAEKSRADAAVTVHEAQFAGAEKQQEFAFDQAEHQSKMMQDAQGMKVEQAKALMKFAQDQQAHNMKMRQSAAEFIQKQFMRRQEAELKKKLMVSSNGKSK